MALINSAESQGFGFLFVSVPETDQHKKQKSGERKGGQANQNATNHSCILPLSLFPPITIRKVVARKRSSALVDICRRPSAHAYSSRPSCCSAASTARAKRGYTCELVERRRLDDGASSPLMIHVFDMADQIADDF